MNAGDLGSARPRTILGIDTGGTFTDVTVLDITTGRLWTAKTSTTPADPSLGCATGSPPQPRSPATSA